MNITTAYNDGQVTLLMEGSLNSAVANDAKQQILSALDECPKIDNIVIDAQKLEYISSLGLRVILSLVKEYEDVRIINASYDVFNIFKMTGFTKMIQVEKALPQVSIDGCEALPYAPDMYRISPDQVVKVFPEDTEKQVVDNEVIVARELFTLGIPTTMPFDIVTVGSCYGLIYEYVEAETLATLLKSHPEKAKHYGALLGDSLRTLHENLIEPEGKIPSAHTRLLEWVQSLAEKLGDDAVSKLKYMLQVVPETSALCHANLSPDNIIIHNDEVIYSYLGSVGYGNPVLDLGLIYTRLPEEVYDAVLRSYYDMESEESVAKSRERLVLLSLLWTATSDAATFKREIADRWDEILSRLKFKMDFQEEILRLERKQFYLDSDVSIDWVAKTLGTNRHYVSDYFNKVLHVSFTDYLNKLRLNHAARLIKSGRVKSSQIAYSAGFNSDHTFRRLFKQYFGCTPSEYK